MNVQRALTREELEEALDKAVQACRHMAAVLQGFTAEELVKRVGDIHPKSFDDAHEELWAVVNDAA